MNLKIVKMFPDVKTPVKANPTDSGFDVYAYRFLKYYNSHGTNFEREFEGDKLQEQFVRDNSIELARNERVLVGTGLKMQYEQGYELQIRARSGLALKQGLSLVNGIGTIDFTYDKEVGIIIVNTSSKTQTIKLGERIAQIVPIKIELPEIEEVIEFKTESRDGFGSSGTK